MKQSICYHRISKGNAMAHKYWLSSLIFFLVGCQWLPPRPSSFPATSNPTSSIPVPNDDFNPLINGRSLLIRDQSLMTFSRVVAGQRSPLPLSPINSPVTENKVASYHVANAELQENFSENIVFGDVPLSTSGIDGMAVNETITGDSVLAWLSAQQPSDESWNRVMITRKEINLSAVYVQDNPYYWFNHYVREEEATTTRYDNEVVYGEGDIQIMFQTEVKIQPRFAFQIHSANGFIYEIYDETYPAGFFGAQDYQIRTIRAPGNFKQALTLGPIQHFLDVFAQLSSNPTHHTLPLQATLNEYQSRILLTKTGAQQFQLTYLVYLGDSFETSLETYQLQTTIAQGQWQTLTKTYLQWQPNISSSIGA
jgi:hypothetical protein